MYISLFLNISQLIIVFLITNTCFLLIQIVKKGFIGLVLELEVLIPMKLINISLHNLDIFCFYHSHRQSGVADRKHVLSEPPSAESTHGGCVRPHQSASAA